jgi:hypothetical protein
MICVKDPLSSGVQMLRTSLLGILGVPLVNNNYIFLPTFSPECTVDGISTPFPLFFASLDLASLDLASLDLASLDLASLNQPEASFSLLPCQTGECFVFAVASKFSLPVEFVFSDGQMRMSTEIVKKNLKPIGKTLSFSASANNGCNLFSVDLGH